MRLLHIAIRELGIKKALRSRNPPRLKDCKVINQFKDTKKRPFLQTLVINKLQSLL